MKVAVFAGHDDDTFDVKGEKGIYTDLTSSGKYEEYDSNIQIAKETVRLLDKQEGVTTLFPQKNGKDMSLEERVDYCNRNNVDTAVFIHSNYSSNSSAKGAAAFYWYNSRDGKRFATIYANEMKKKGYDLWSNGTYPCEPNKWSNFFVVRGTSMPVILTENFFFSNRDELKNILLDPNELKKVAEVHARAVCGYANVEYKDSEQGGGGNVDKADKFAHEAQEWVKEQDVSDGSRPRDNVTRQELWTMLHRYAKLEQNK